MLEMDGSPFNRSPKTKGVKLIKLICACFLQFSCLACIMNNCCLHINKANSF